MTTLVIAEAGVNHNGDLGLAVELVHAAASAGADIVKFQTFSTDDVVCRWATRAPYQAVNTGEQGSQADMLRSLELSLESFLALKGTADSCGIEFLSTAFDVESLAFLVKHGAIARIKIPSGEVSNLPFLLAVSRFGLPMLMSTGMSFLDEVAMAVDTIAYGMREPEDPQHWTDMVGYADQFWNRKELRDHLTLLHCTTDYPASDEDLNLRCLVTLRDATGLDVGYSDHSVGLLASVAAVSLGATVIEKHLTLDRGLPGPDHAASMEPADFADLVMAIRRTETLLGSSQKMPVSGEAQTREIARRSLTATQPIAEGDRFTLGNLGCKRPGAGLPPKEYWSLLGAPAPRALDVDEQLPRDWSVERRDE